MLVTQTIQKLLVPAIPRWDPRLQKLLFEMVQALLAGASLTTTSIGRGLKRNAWAKHRIKATDRFVNNPRVWSAQLGVYRRLAHLLDLQGPTPILIDWVNIGYHHNAFVAAVPFQGRALPIYAEVYPLSSLNNPSVHYKALHHLQYILPKSCRPILVTDAAFSSNWIKQVNAMQWDYVTRIRYNVCASFQKPNDIWTAWTNKKTIYSWANETSQDLGKAELAKTNPTETRLVLGAAPIRKGRIRKGIRGTKIKRGEDKKHRERESEPWLLATSLTDRSKVIRLYSTRMQIEESFRELKSHRFGFALRYSRSSNPAALNVLMMLGSLGSLCLVLLGLGAEKESLQFHLQSNSTKTRRVLSLNFLGRALMRTDQRLLERLPAFHVCLGHLRIQIREWWLTSYA